MKQFYILMLTIFTVNFGFGQTEIFNETGGGSAPTGWAFTNNITSEPIDKGTYWLVDAGSPSDIITTSAYDLSSYTNAEFTMDIRSFGSGTHRQAKIEISYDGGSNFTQTEISNTTTTSYSNIGTITLNSVSNQVVLRISNNGSSGRGVRMQNLVLTASGAVTTDTEIEFSSTSATVSEGDGTYNLELTITNEDAANATTCNVVITSGDASDVDNYTTQLVTFPANDNTNQTVVITITDDVNFETDETITFSIQNVSGGNNAAVGTNNNFDLTITNNDPDPSITIALQDFDSTTPEWGYNNDISFFDNNWGTDGYYGIIDISSASPINNSNMQGNILGENDLDDEGNGTTGFATVSFETIDISNFDFVTLSFDWDVVGYNANNDDARYEVFYDGIGQGEVYLLNGGVDAQTNEGSVSLNIPNTVNTISLNIEIRNNGNTGYSGFDNIKLTGIFNGSTYSAASWTPTVPSNSTSSTNGLIRDGNYIINSDIELNSLYILNGATVTIEKTGNLTLTNNLINLGTVSLESDSNEFSSLIVNGIASGNINYERFTAQVGPTGTNDLVSPPVAGQQFGAFATANTGVLAESSDLRAFAPFDKTAPTADYVNYDVTVNNTTPINPGTGYRAGTNTGSTLTFNGTVNTASINVPISHSGNGYEAWNLIGNPYPSYISLDDFLTENTSELDPSAVAVYGYDGDASNGWHIWNAAYELANPGSLIAPGQGFFVASKTGGGSIDFTTTMRSTGSSDDFIGGDVMNPNFALASLELTKDANTFNTDIYFIDGQTRGLDAGYDAASFNNNANIFTALVEDNNGVNMAIQALPYNDFNDVVVPLGIKANAGEQVTIGLGNNTVPNTINIYLEDTGNNTWTLLNDGDYTFTPSNTLNETGQLYVHFNADTLSNSESTLNNITIYAPNNSNTIIVKGQLLDNTNFSLFDVQGRIVMTKLLDSNNNTNVINTSNLSSGIYIAQITSNGINKTQKIIVE
ncbi:T9SS type A sorting domain-containing protein [Pontimicrobium sp. IMCC45349]|uniref:T9SS type A sorting domain-containing protein n=1 Tax=Pontimicrobium sp. IMCC45349 TaxID=3391574 RepID=UPI0039A294F9